MMEKHVFLKNGSGNPIKITCQTCQHDMFVTGSNLLNTRGLTYLRYEWLNKNATTLTCTSCGTIKFIAEEYLSEWEIN